MKRSVVAGTLLALHVAVRVRLTRKLAERVDGVDLTKSHVGDALNLPSREAQLLIAEKWATLDERRRTDTGPPVTERRHPDLRDGDDCCGAS